jgi:hypothetical protein
MTIEQVARLPENPPATADVKSGFIFDHLPKTGGSALRLVFEEIFGAENVSPHLNIGKTEQWAEKNRSSYRMIVGHFHSPIPRMGLSQQRVRMTMLRDPIDRALSEYFYFRNDVHNAPWDKLVTHAKEHDLYAYIKMLEAKGDIAVSNRYAHHFAAQVSRGPWRERELLSSAREAIGAYDFVGVQEQFVDSADVFCCVYGLRPAAKIPRANTTSERIALRDLDSRTRERLIRLNQVDLEIYNLVCSRFQSQKREIFARHEAAGPVCAKAIDGQEKAILTLATQSEPKIGSFGDRAVEFCAARVSGYSSRDGAVNTGETAFVRLTIAAHIDVPDLTVGLHIADDVGEVVFGTNTYILGEGRPVEAGKKYEAIFMIKADIRHGRYFVGGSLHTGASRADRCFHWCEQLAQFDVVDGANGPFVGYCRLDTRVEWEEVPAKVARA